MESDATSLFAMGGSHNRDGPELSDSDQYTDEEEEEEYTTPTRTLNPSPSPSPTASTDSMDRKLKALHLMYSNPISSSNPNSPNPNPSSQNAVELYLHVGGSSPAARWVLSEKITIFSFSRCGSSEEEDCGSSPNPNARWYLVAGLRILVPVGLDLQLKSFPGQKRYCIIADEVWAIKFLHPQGYSLFLKQYQDCLFENKYGMESTEQNKVKVYGSEFMGWGQHALNIESRGLQEEFEEEDAAELGIQSLALGTLDNCFLVGNSGIQVVKIR